MSHYFQQACFVQSATTPKTLPAEMGLEVAFAGRSNSGKSSTINCLCSQRALARTSKTPGRTQLINFFDLPDGNRLVDLPGYGYAKVPETVKLQWQKFIEAYLTTRSVLKGLILVMDIRHPLTSFDRGMLEWSVRRRLPVHVVLNKADKLNRGPASSTVLSVRKEVRELWGEQVSVQMHSSHSGQGQEELRVKLWEWLHPESVQ